MAVHNNFEKGLFRDKNKSSPKAIITSSNACKLYLFRCEILLSGKWIFLTVICYFILCFFFCIFREKTTCRRKWFLGLALVLVFSVYIICYCIGGNRYVHLTVFPKKPWFLRGCNSRLLKTLWEKEKLLVTSYFSSSHSVFHHFGVLLPFLFKN